MNTTDYLSEIDMRLEWLKALAELLISQGELIETSIYPSKKAISNTGWLIETIVEEIEGYSDMLEKRL